MRNIIDFIKSLPSGLQMILVGMGLIQGLILGLGLEGPWYMVWFPAITMGVITFLCVVAFGLVVMFVQPFCR